MSNWDLMMPGMGLTAIGIAGVFISYAEIAHTFIDGMHALTGLTMFIGLIFLACGILEGGVSTSTKAKATTLVILGISLSFAAVAIATSAVESLPVFAGIMILVAIPAILIAYVYKNFQEYAKPVSAIFVLATIAGITAYVGFGLVGPVPYLIPPEPTEELSEQVEVPLDAPIFSIAILAGSSEQGSPDYEPDVAKVPKGHAIEWTNEDEVVHTVTSSIDFGETFDSGMVNAGEKFVLDTSDLSLGEYEYMCIVHPWMIATLVIEEPREPIISEVSIPEGAGIQQIGQKYYDPEVLTISVGTTVKWTNNDNAVHTVTSGTPDGGPSADFDSSIIDAGATFEYTFNNPETADYYCIVHPWMLGTVNAE